ncbi:SLBB domain-containing protein [Candidatus Ozemobacteraceae bacterium]|nr:SLBB domain-containing protein [Candidatus Ozemobacteraceae bacterium]
MIRFHSFVAAGFIACMIAGGAAVAQTRPSPEALAGLRSYQQNPSVPGERMKPGRFNEVTDSIRTDSDLGAKDELKLVEGETRADPQQLKKRIEILEEILRRKIEAEVAIEERNKIKQEIKNNEFILRNVGGVYRERPGELDINDMPLVDDGMIRRKTDEALGREIADKPFGTDFFASAREVSATPDNLSVPSTYVLGPGDSLKIIIWSDMGDETVYDVVVNPEGQVYIPIIGLLGVTGSTVGQFEQTVIGSLSGKFAHFKGQVTLTKVRTLQIFVTGEVAQPGAMAISALSTAFQALYRAGGPNLRGSMRKIRIMRGSQVVSNIDLYKYLMTGDKTQDVALENGDTLFVPPTGPRVAIRGEVIRPARFELAEEKNLADVLALAGGIQPSASSLRIKVYRWQGDQRRKMLDVGMTEDVGALSSFRVASGDEIEVEKALEEIANGVLIEGAVWRPGEYAADEGVTLAALLKRAGGLKSEEAAASGQLIRKLDGGHESIISFDPIKAIAGGKDGELQLQARDLIRVFSKSEIEADIRFVTISGAVRRPGEYIYRDGMKIRDLVLRAKGLTPDSAGEAEVARVAKGRTSEMKRIDLKKILQNPKDPDNLPVQPLDKVNILARGDIILESEVVILKGEVKKPGPYALRNRGETLEELIERAGGFTDAAFPEGAIFMRKIGNIADDEQLNAAEQVRKELFHQANIDMRAELLRAGAKLSDVADQQSRNEILDMPSGDPQLDAELKSGLLGRKRKTKREEFIQSLSAESQTTKYGTLELSSRSFRQDALRIPIRLKGLKDRARGRNNGDDIVLRNGDEITIPPIPDTVSVVGAVVNPSTLIYREGMSARSYINSVGGFAEHSNHGKTIVVRANGEVMPLRRVGSIRRGDIVLVPPKPRLVRRNKLQETSQIAQILGNLAVVYKVALDANN